MKEEGVGGDEGVEDTDGDEKGVVLSQDDGDRWLGGVQEENDYVSIT